MVAGPPVEVQVRVLDWLSYLKLATLGKPEKLMMITSNYAVYMERNYIVAWHTPCIWLLVQNENDRQVCSVWGNVECSVLVVSASEITNSIMTYLRAKRIDTTCSVSQCYAGKPD